MHPIMVQLTPALCLSRIFFFFFKLGMMSTTDGRTQLCFSNGHSSDLPLSSPHLRLKRVRWGNQKIKTCLDLERRGTSVALGQLHFFCRKQTQWHQLFKIGWRGKTFGEHTEILMKKYPCKKEGLRSCPCVFMHKVFVFSFFLECTPLQCLYYRVHRAAPTCLSECLCVCGRHCLLTCSVEWGNLPRNQNAQGVVGIKLTERIAQSFKIHFTNSQTMIPCFY